MKRQVVVIHGGDSFPDREAYLDFLGSWEIDFERYRNPKYDWKRTLGEELGPEFEVILPDMPNKLNAQYEEWRIWFEKFIPYFTPGVTLIGHSLGGIFLAKFLSEKDLPVRVAGTFLVAAPSGEGSFGMPGSFGLLARQGGKIFLYQSRDDKVVPFAELEKFRRALPEATVRIFEDRGHFNDERLPEIVEDIRSLP